MSEYMINADEIRNISEPWSDIEAVNRFDTRITEFDLITQYLGCANYGAMICAAVRKNMRGDDNSYDSIDAVKPLLAFIHTGCLQQLEHDIVEHDKYFGRQGFGNDKDRWMKFLQSIRETIRARE